MNKVQAYHSFWAGFGLSAYDETTVPDGAILPYITYESAYDSFDHEIALTASVWYRSSSWEGVTEKSLEIADEIGRGGKLVTYDGGVFWIHRGHPFAQRYADPNDDSIRRIVLNVSVEFID